MDKKIYIVTLKRREDLETFYAEMEEKGFSLSMKRPLSRNTHYWMTEDDAVTLREDDRVIDVQLPFNERNIGIENYASYEPYSITGRFWKDDTVAPATIDVNDYQWGHIHCAGQQPQRGLGQFGSISEGGTYEDVTDTIEVFNNGNNVDLVIVDDPVSADCDEWISPSTGQNRFVPYQWFNELNTYVTSIDDDNQTAPTGSITYHTQATNPRFHGVHVAGTAAGRHYGWAREANIYSLQILGGAMPSGQSIPSLLIFDYLRAFHANKPLVNGRRNPTVTNHSWGMGYTTALQEHFGNTGMQASDFQYIYFNGTYYDAANPNPSGWTIEGIEADFGIGRFKYAMPAYDAAIAADVEDAVEDGIVIIAAAGNGNYHSCTYNDQEWNNSVYINHFGQNFFFNRGNTPGNAEGVINVGALGNYHQFQRATYTQFGPDIDVYAPGTNIVSAWTDPSLINDPNRAGQGLADSKYGGSNWFYPISGTSMASPQVAGVAACLATNSNRFTNDDVFEYLEKTSIMGEMAFDIGPAFTPNTYTIDVTAPTSNDYVFANASDRVGNPNGNDPDITVWAGDTLEFNVNVGIHSFYIKWAQNTGTGETVLGVTNNGSTTGTITWDTSGVTPGTYYYICQYHSGMTGRIFVGPGSTTGSFADNTKSGRSPNAVLHAASIRPATGYLAQLTKKIRPTAPSGQRFPRPRYLYK
tara:strand:+ start:3285 stop:5375 length:2091 start_codon:yes stop_codon:yes gene_type:complete